MNYPSDLTDAQWALIVELTARPDPRGAVRRHPMREIINAVLYVNKTGCQWRLLPVNFAPWATVYDYFRRFRQRGAWEAMMLRLNGKVREKGGRAPAPSSTPKASKARRRDLSAAFTEAKRSRAAAVRLPWTPGV